MTEPGNGEGGWIPQGEYEQILGRVPIVCVDVLPISRSGQFGLILRETTGGETGWCLTGGAVRRNQSLEVAISSQMECTLGRNFTYELVSTRPLTVAQYFPDPSVGELHDPRKHAVALTYAAVLDGDPEAQAGGEALDFRWYSQDQLSGVVFGFDQGRIIREVVDLLDRRDT